MVRDEGYGIKILVVLYMVIKMRMNRKIVNVIFGSFCISLVTAAVCTLIEEKTQI